jgi:ribA/ribD-fused uncharacterized protein
MAITDWRGDYAFLRNDDFCEIEWEFGDQTLVFNSVEELFQAFKAEFADDGAALDEIAECESAREAKRIGSQVDLDVDEWNKKRESFMRRAVRAKYDQDPSLQNQLIATGSQPIVMHYRDSFWGDGGDGSGENKLGKIHMEIRSELTQLAVAGKTSVGPSFKDDAIPLPPIPDTSTTTNVTTTTAASSSATAAATTIGSDLDLGGTLDLGDKDEIKAPDFGTDGLAALKNKYLKT